MKLSSEELIACLNGLLGGHAFAPRTGVLAEGQECAVQIVPAPLGESGVCHLDFELMPEGEFEPIHIWLRQTAETGESVIREARTDGRGRARFRYVLMHGPCVLEFASVPSAYQRCRRVANPRELEAGGCEYRNVRLPGSEWRRRIADPAEAAAGPDDLGRRMSPGSPDLGGAAPGREELAFEAAGGESSELKYLDATAYQPPDRSFSVILEQTAAGRTAVTVSTRDDALREALVVVRLGSETRSRAFPPASEHAAGKPGAEVSEVRWEFAAPYRTAVGLGLSIDFLMREK